MTRLPFFGPRPEHEQDFDEFEKWKLRLRSCRGRRAKAVLAEAWRYIGSHRILTPIGRILRAHDRTRDDDERISAIMAMGILADPIGLLSAHGILEDSSTPLTLRMAAIHALARGGAWASATLEKALDRNNPEPLRLAAARGLLGSKPHAGAAAVVTELATDPVDRTHRRLRTFAALSTGDTSGIAVQGIDGNGWPEVSTWALAAARERQHLDQDALVLRLFEADDLAVALEAPALVRAIPDLVAGLLDQDWDPSENQAGRRLWLAGLLGDAGIGVYSRWARHPQAPTRVHLLAGLAGGADTGNTAWKLGRCLRTPEGLADLLDMLTNLAVSGESRELHYTLLHHRQRWPHAVGSVNTAVAKALRQANPSHKNDLVWLAGELALRDCEDDIAAVWPNSFSAWALGEIASARALQYLRTLALPLGSDDKDLKARNALFFACIMHGIDRGAVTPLCQQSVHEPYAIRYALISADRAITLSASNKTIDAACLALIRNGSSWIGPQSEESLDEAAIVLQQTRHPGAVVQLLTVTVDDAFRCELLDRIQGELKTGDQEIILRVIKELEQEDGEGASVALNYLRGISASIDKAGIGDDLPAGLPPISRRRIGWALRLLQAGGENASAALPMLGAPLEDLARTALAAPFDQHVAPALLRRWNTRIIDVATRDGAISDKGHAIIRETLALLGHDRSPVDPDKAKFILAAAIRKMARIHGTWQAMSHEARPSIDSLGCWALGLGIMALNGIAFRLGRPDAPAAEALISAMLSFQLIRNVHTHRMVLCAHSDIAQANDDVHVICRGLVG